ncbi:MAG: MFS transporter [Chloroflexota bacterium]|nr:MAG: MFS transporter [Chloroflexota bacterium]
MITIVRKKITQTQKLLGALTAGHLVNDFYSSTLPFLLPALIVAFNLSFFEAGLLTIATSLLSGFLQPVVGYFADIYARRKMTILLGFSAFSLGLILASSSVSYPMLLAALFVFGLGQATFHAQSTNLITRAFPRSRGRSMGIHGIGGSIGHFSAPILATLLITALGWRYATSLLVIPGLVIIIFLGYMLSEPPKAQKMAKGTPIISARLLVLTLNIGLIYMAYIGFLAFLPTFLVENGSSLTQAGLITATMFFVGVLAQPAGGFIYDRLGGRLMFASSSLLAGLGLLFFTLESSIHPIIFIIIIGAAVQATYPVSLAMGSELAKGDNVGVSVGFVFGVSGVLAAFAPALTGYAADSFGLLASFRLLVILAVLALAVSFFLPGKQLDS